MLQLALIASNPETVHPDPGVAGLLALWAEHEGAID